MSSVESDFEHHPGDGPDGAFLVWLVPVFWPFLILRLLLSMVPETLSFPQPPSGPMAKTSPHRLPIDPPRGGGFEPFDPLPRRA